MRASDLSAGPSKPFDRIEDDVLFLEWVADSALTRVDDAGRVLILIPARLRGVEPLIGA